MPRQTHAGFGQTLEINWIVVGKNADHRILARIQVPRIIIFDDQCMAGKWTGHGCAAFGVKLFFDQLWR